MIGKPIFDYPPEHRAPEGEGCTTCGIVLEADAIGSYCSPECCEWPDRCEGCRRGPTWCMCEYTHCIDCGEPLSERDQERKFRTCGSLGALLLDALAALDTLAGKEQNDTHPSNQEKP